MKKYQDESWLQQCMEQGWTIKDIANRCNVSTYTVSKYFTKAVDNLTFDQVLQFVTKYEDLKQLLSHKTQMYKSLINQTNHLPNNYTLRQRLWHLQHGDERPKCYQCLTKNTNWDKDLQAYRKYCSTTCMSKSDDVKNKRIQTNNKKYGTNYWNQQHINDVALQHLNDKDWLYEQHKNQKKSLVSIGNELGVHPLLPAQYLKKHNICGEQTSTVGKQFVDTIKQIYSGEVVENTKKIITPYELDVYLPNLNIAFEFNGLYWHSDLQGKGKNYHLNKTRMCEQQGIRLIHVFEHQWYNTYNIVISRLNYLLHNTQNITPINARDCTVQQISTTQAFNFYEQNHIQGGVNCSINYGLIYNGKIVSVIGFSKSRLSKKYQYELVRFCNATHTNVRGGADKLFKTFIKQHYPQSIVSYSDKCWNTGNLYTSLGFVHSHSSQPNYWYFKANDFTVYSRIKFQKHKLQKQLNVFDANLSEWENMKANKYNRFWDCGNDVYVWYIS